MRISDCSSDVCSSDLLLDALAPSREARRRYQEANYSAGELAASANIAAILVRLDRNRDEAEQLLGDSADRKSVVEGTSVAVRVARSGRSIIKNKKRINK